MEIANNLADLNEEQRKELDVREACQRSLFELTNGFGCGKDATEQAVRTIETYGFEKIRKAIVSSAYGYYLAHKGTHSYLDNHDPYDTTSTKDMLDYLDEHLTIELTESHAKEWEDSSVCYLDFENRQVYLQ